MLTFYFFMFWSELWFLMNKNFILLKNLSFSKTYKLELIEKFEKNNTKSITSFSINYRNTVQKNSHNSDDSIWVDSEKEPF